MQVTIHIKDSNYLVVEVEADDGAPVALAIFARAELVRLEDDNKSKRAVVVAAEKARDATTYIGDQLSDSQQVRLAMAAIKKVFNEINEQ